MYIWYVWSMFYTLTRFGSPYQPSSDRAWVRKQGKGERAPITKNICKIIINNYNLLTLLLQKGTLKVYVEVFGGSFSFPVYITLCLASNGAVFSISSVLSVCRRYIVNSYCRRMLQIDSRPADRPTTVHPLSNTRFTNLY